MLLTYEQYAYIRSVTENFAPSCDVTALAAEQTTSVTRRAHWSHRTAPKLGLLDVGASKGTKMTIICGDTGYIELTR